jgi:hypothetical protein
MIRKLSAFLAALALTVTGAAGLAVATSSAAQASVIPVVGTYGGVDHGGRPVSLSYNGVMVTHVTIGTLTIGGAHVSNGMWHETCHNGYCTKGQWITDKHVQGYWRHGSSSTWTPFTASTSVVTPYVGPYMGRDRTNLSIHFRYHQGYVRAFTWDHNVIGDAQVMRDGSFSACTHTFCFKGHWQSDYDVAGEWRHASSSSWTTWDAHAYAV